MPGSPRACSRPARSGSSCAPSRTTAAPRDSSTKRSTSSRPTVKPGCVEDASPAPALSQNPPARDRDHARGDGRRGRRRPPAAVADEALDRSRARGRAAATRLRRPGRRPPGRAERERAARVGQRRHHRDLPRGLDARHGVAGDLRAAGTAHGLRARRRPVRARSAAVARVPQPPPRR